MTKDTVVLNQHLGQRARADHRAVVDRLTGAKIAQRCSNATVNRTLELLRAILRKCVNGRERLDGAPSAPARNCQ